MPFSLLYSRGGGQLSSFKHYVLMERNLGLNSDPCLNMTFSDRANDVIASYFSFTLCKWGS
jgi:hypothetical protein